MSVLNFQDAKDSRRILAEFIKFGWDVVRGPGTATGPTIYFVDVDSASLYVVGLVSDGIQILQEKTHRMAFSFDAVCDALGTLLGELGSGEASMNSETRGALSVGAGLYIAGTRSYSIGVAQGWRQYVVLRYRDHSKGGHLLRPNPLGTNRPLSPSEIEVVAGQILATDMHNHPERFSKAQVIPFKLRASANKDGDETP